MPVAQPTAQEIVDSYADIMTDQYTSRMARKLGLREYRSARIPSASPARPHTERPLPLSCMVHDCLIEPHVVNVWPEPGFGALAAIMSKLKIICDSSAYAAQEGAGCGPGDAHV